MPEPWQDTMAKLGKTLDVKRYKRTLGELFPHDNPDSPTMWRLAIVRDDISFEMHQALLEDDADEHRIWEHGYFRRRLSVSVLEAKSLLEHDVSKLLKRWPAQKALHAKITALFPELAALNDAVRPVRDSLGAHIRPNSANPDPMNTESYDVRGLKTHAAWPGEIEVNPKLPLGTSYRSFTKFAFLFANPEVVDSETFTTSNKELRRLIIDTSDKILEAIDAVLYAFWLALGAIEPL